MTPFPRNQPESWEAKAFRGGFNLSPLYRATGGRLIYPAHCNSEIQVARSLTFWTRNYVGTIFSGSLYKATDPIYMLMLTPSLGPEYLVWDQVATIRLCKPGKSALYARFALTHAQLCDLRIFAAQSPSVDRVYTVEPKWRGSSQL